MSTPLIPSCPARRGSATATVEGMTHRISTFVTALALAGLAVFLGILQALVVAPEARALTGAGHGPGYLSRDGWWLGTYRMDDGAQGFCLNLGKESPTGHGLDYAESAALGWYSPQQSASLAYISRTWAGTGDQLTAAAGQIATWLVAGLNGHTPEEVAARAGGDAARVLALAYEMVNEAARFGTNSVRADTVVELAENGPGRVRVELTVARPSGLELLAPASHLARVTLEGAVFADGEATAQIPTGTDIDIVPTGTDTSVTVTAHAELASLPYGDRMLVAVPHDDAQSVLIAVLATAEAHAAATVTGPSPLPFQPVVTTVTSTPDAAPGAVVHDRITVSVDTADGLLPSWGVRATDDGFEPIAAIVESTLHGPFDEPITQSDTAPEDSPVVCVVETPVDGTGEYETPECALPAAGYYVWTERIDPATMAPDAGGERMRPWQSAFGIASEITMVSAPVETETAVLAETGDRVEAGPTAFAAALAGLGIVTTLFARFTRRGAHHAGRRGFRR